MIKIVSLSKDKVRNLFTIEATFSVDGNLVPLRVSEEDKSELYAKVNKLITTPGVDIEAISTELYTLMAPAARIKNEIQNSKVLSGKLVMRGGALYFGDFRLEEALASHMLSMLNEDNLPKDEVLWKSYIRFLDNLHQNVNEEIRTQLFRWMAYENNAGHPFAITEDGCLVGYKGCGGSILEPVSVHSGFAIVDGVEMRGQIPNRVGSVITMPRSEVQYDPGVGCSYGLHVGTRTYAMQWAPILLRVKVNPRDVVSVPFECESQKMRVCEYTVLEVTAPTEGHKMFFPDTEPTRRVIHGDAEVSLDDVLDLLHTEVFVEYDGGEKEFRGTIVEIYESRWNPGIIVKNEDGEYKHIKLDRISYLEEIVDSEDEDFDGFEDFEGCESECDFEGDCDCEDCEECCDELEDEDLLTEDEIMGMLGKEVYVEYDEDKSFEGVLSAFYEDTTNPGIIMRNNREGHKHLKLNRITYITVVDPEDEEDEEVEPLVVDGIELQNGMLAAVVSQVAVDFATKKTSVYTGRIDNVDSKNKTFYIEGNKINASEVLSITII